MISIQKEMILVLDTLTARGLEASVYRLLIFPHKYLSKHRSLPTADTVGEHAVAKFIFSFSKISIPLLMN